MKGPLREGSIKDGKGSGIGPDGHVHCSNEYSHGVIYVMIITRLEIC